MVNEGIGVGVGSRVVVRDGELEESWWIVPAHEADALRGWISEDCPLARALSGHGPGDVVQVQGPGGRRHVTLLSVGECPS
jgi:transcription elongation GreA/GreB family factor